MTKYSFPVCVSLLFLVGGGCRTSSSISSDVTSSSTVEATTSTVLTAPVRATSTKSTTTKKTPPSKLQLQPNAPKTTKPGPQTLVVQIKDSSFSPQVIAINAGDTIVWINKAASNHTVASSGSLLWDSGNILPGKSYSRQFKSAGSYAYHCGAHPSMTGTVVVY